MTYARIENGAVAEYPVYENDLRLRFSNVSFPTPFVAPEGYEAVQDATYPDVDYKSNVHEGEPVLVDGVWTRNWVVTPATTEELAVRDSMARQSVRQERNERLSQTDWRFRSDMTPSQDWIDYCQALRDITAQEGFPHNITWPTKPE